jgi:hypothetical protein
VEGHRYAEALLRLVAAAALLLALAGCGSGSKSLSASCDRQRSELDAIGAVRSLADAQRAIPKVIAIERRGATDLRAAKADAQLVAAYEGAIADARRLELSLASADPTQTMSALRMGPSAGSRTVERALLLAHRACSS